MEFDRVVSSRHSTRKFQETNIPHYSKIIECIKSAASAPLAGNLPVIKYIVILDKKTIRELSIAAQQDFIAQAGYVIAICTDKKLLEKYYYERAEKYARQQAGAVIENFLLKVADLKLASCWIGAFDDDSVKRILKIPDEIDIEALLPVGYDMPDFRQKKEDKEPKLDNLVFFNKYGEAHMTPIKKVGAMVI